MQQASDKKVVRVITAQGAKVRLNVPTVKAPRPMVGALSCCCSTN